MADGCFFLPLTFDLNFHYLSGAALLENKAMKAKVLFTASALFCCLFVLAQEDVGLSLAGGLSKITFDNKPGDITQTIYFTPCAQGGFFYNHQFSNYMIGVDLLLQQVEGNEHLDQVQLDMNGNPTSGHLTTDIHRHMSYLAMPLYYGYKLNKLTVHIGIQPAFLYLNGTDTKFTANQSVYTSSEKIKTDKSIDLGVRAGLGYRLTDFTSVELMYAYGLHEPAVPDYTIMWNTQQLTLGIRYLFFTHP
jgi:opacity protein-like surface antigen